MSSDIRALLFEIRRHTNISRITYGERRARELDSVCALLDELEARIEAGEGA